MPQLGVVRPGPSFTFTTPVSRKPAAPTGNQNLTSPYGGAEPGTISAQPFLDYSEQIRDLSLDPRNEIRDREQQILQEQTRAGLEARGLNLSGAGAGIENQAMQDFALDWQNEQLDRAAQGAGAFNILGSTAQNIANTGFQNAMQLGASAFEYAPEIQPSAPSFSYGGHTAYSPPSGGGFQSSNFKNTPTRQQIRRQQEQPYLSSLNAQAASQPSRYETARQSMFSPGGSRYRPLGY